MIVRSSLPIAQCCLPKGPEGMSASPSALETPGGPAEIGAQRADHAEPDTHDRVSQRPQRSSFAPASSLIPRMKAAATMPATRRSPTRSTAPPTGRTPGCIRRHRRRPGGRTGAGPVGQVDRERGGVLSRRHQLPEHRLRREPVQDELRAYGPRNSPRLNSGSSRTPMPSIIRKKRRREATSWGNWSRYCWQRAAGSPAWRH